MKGATAEPCVRTIKLPSSKSMTKIGRSQNFFRSFIKAHSSIKNSPIATSQRLSSKLVLHMSARPSILSGSISFMVCTESLPQRVFPHETAGKPDRSDHAVEYDAE